MSFFFYIFQWNCEHYALLGAFPLNWNVVLYFYSNVYGLPNFNKNSFELNCIRAKKANKIESKKYIFQFNMENKIHRQIVVEGHRASTSESNLSKSNASICTHTPKFLSKFLRTIRPKLEWAAPQGNFFTPRIRWIF